MKKLGQITRSPLFWIFQVLLFLCCTYLSLQYYPKAFPIVDLQIKMDRLTALKSASEMAINNHWGPQNFRQSANFDSDDRTQTFVELSAGGSAAFAKIVKDGLYSPYTWRVRHFAEGKTNETQIRFTPQGDFYGFSEKLPEDEPGKALSVADALKIAQITATKNWKVPLDQYQLIEKSAETKPSHRIDHTFVYERPREQLGEGRYRLILLVSGDRLTEISYFVKIPDSFSRKYGEMRSFNDTISEIASVAMVVLYLLGGCGLGIFFLARKRWVIWKTPLILAAIVSGFQFLEQINHLPLIWMNYDTALSASGFLFRNATWSFIMFLVDFVLLAVSFMAAESLTRKAFPKHPQLWRIWYPENASTLAILGRTIGGYLSVGFFFSFVVFMYIFGTQCLGWWNPSDTLFHPDGLATYCPWFTSISNSLHAGFWEESLFRAVPLASAALLGARFGRRNLWLIAGFLLQALIFASAHANYPAQPSYARVVELIIPSFVFGGFYLLFGLLPGIILHYTFDVVSFSIPLFAASSPGIWVDRGLVILFSLIPVWILLVARLRKGKWNELKSKELNQAWHPEEKRASQAKPRKEHQQRLLNPIAVKLFGAGGVLALILWFSLSDFKGQTIPLNVGRQQAISIARTALENSGIHLSPSWQALASTAGEIGSEDRFIWKTEGKERFRELNGTYLMPPAWFVRFVRFDTDVEERAEEFQVYIIKNGEVYRTRHELPESRKGASIEEGEARKISIAWIEKTYGLNPSQLKEISSRASKLPNRRDWLFIFSDSAVKLKTGEARIGVHVAGDQAISSRRFIFIPEEWERQETNQENMISIVKSISLLVLVIIFATGVVLSLLSWTQKKFSTRTFVASFGLLCTVGFASMINGFPGRLAQFSTIEPRINQMISLLSIGAVKILFFSTCLALLIGYLHRKTPSSEAHRETDSLHYSRPFLGYSIGIVGAVLAGSIQHLFPSASPTIGKINALDSYYPLLWGFNEIEYLILLTLLLALAAIIAERITVAWSKRWILGSAFLLLFSLALSGLRAQTLSEWILQALSGGVYLVLVYPYFIRARMNLLPLTAGSLLLLLEIRQLAMNSYIGAVGESVVGMGCLVLASYGWHRRMMTSK